MDYSLISIAFIVAISAVGGFFGGAYYTKRKTEKHFKENPPISEKQIRAMYLSMGRKPSEAQIQATLRQMGIKKQ